MKIWNRLFRSYPYTTPQAQSFRSVLQASAKENSKHVFLPYDPTQKSSISFWRDAYHGVMVCSEPDQVGQFYGECQMAVKDKQLFAVWYTSANKMFKSHSWRDQGWLEKEMKLPHDSMHWAESWNMFQPRTTNGLMGMIIIDHAEKLQDTYREEPFWNGLATSSSNIKGFLVAAFVRDPEYAKRLLTYNSGVKFCRLEREKGKEEGFMWNQSFVY